METFTVKVEKLVYGGEGLGYHTGKPVFVPYVLPGEVVEVFPVEESRKFIRAVPDQVRQAAGERIAAECPVFARCGGCHYQHLRYPDQLRLKGDILRETLRRLGKIEWNAEIPAHASPPWRYRNRVQLKLGPHPVQAETVQIGFHRAGSHTLCSVESCPISSPKLNELIEVLHRLNAARALPGSLRSLEAFADDRDETLWISVTAPKMDFDAGALAEALRTELNGILSLEFHEAESGRRVTDGLGWIYWHLGPHRWRISHRSFFQVNRHLVPKVVERVTAGLEGNVVLDLYAGVGLFTRVLSEKFARAVAVEADREAAADLTANLSDREGTEAVTGRAGDFLRAAREKCDVVLLDPPRNGLESDVAQALLELAPPRILYLSCDPATLARDLSRLAPAYHIAELELIDLFPQTYHIETLARLERV